MSTNFNDIEARAKQAKQQKAFAWQWAQETKAALENTGTDEVCSPQYAAADYIINHVDEPSLADIGFNIKDHFLAEAYDYSLYQRVIMLDTLDKRILVIPVNDSDGVRSTDPENLYLTGNHYGFIKIK
jgi:hypothetical protein